MWCHAQIKGPSPKSDIGGGLDIPKTLGADTLKQMGKDASNAVSRDMLLLNTVPNNKNSQTHLHHMNPDCSCTPKFVCKLQKKLLNVLWSASERNAPSFGFCEETCTDGTSTLLQAQANSKQLSKAGEKLRGPG